MRVEIRTVQVARLFDECDREVFVAPHHIKLVQALYTHYANARIAAIKFMREEYRLDLKAAKDLCDAIGAQA